MLDKQHDNFTTGTLDGDGNFIGTVDANINHLKSIVHNLAPNSSSGSSAKIASGKTDIMKYKKIEDALGKVEHILTDSKGHPYTRQHTLGKHGKDHMERILKFLGKELSEGEDTDDPRFGTFENAAGDIIHILKLKEEAISTSSRSVSAFFASMTKTLAPTINILDEGPTTLTNQSPHLSPEAASSASVLGTAVALGLVGVSLEESLAQIRKTG
jgi:hypothetical protein